MALLSGCRALSSAATYPPGVTFLLNVDLLHSTTCRVYSHSIRPSCTPTMPAACVRVSRFLTARDRKGKTRRCTLYPQTLYEYECHCRLCKANRCCCKAHPKRESHKEASSLGMPLSCAGSSDRHGAIIREALPRNRSVSGISAFQCPIPHDIPTPRAVAAAIGTPSSTTPALQVKSSGSSSQEPGSAYDMIVQELQYCSC